MSYIKRQLDKLFDRQLQQLLPDEVRAKLPPLYANEDIGVDALAVAKFFTPWTSWTWYASEFDGQDTFFGLVSGHDVELGYFSLSELLSVRGPHGLFIERDEWFQLDTLRYLRQQEQNRL